MRDNVFTSCRQLTRCFNFGQVPVRSVLLLVRGYLCVMRHLLRVPISRIDLVYETTDCGSIIVRTGDRVSSHLAKSYAKNAANVFTSALVSVH